MPIVNLGSAINGHKLIVSLCDYSGRWLRGYHIAGYSTIRFDLKHGDDVTNFDATVAEILDFCDTIRAAYGRQIDFAGVLAAPPCTDFSVSGAQYWPAKDADGRTAASVRVAAACMDIIEWVSPRWWALENPVGRIGKLLPEIGKPWYFNPCDYAGYSPDPEADRYTKKTGIWGTAVKPTPKALEPIRYCKQGSWLQKLGGSSERTKELRSMTPVGFANAFSLANP